MPEHTFLAQQNLILSDNFASGIAGWNANLASGYTLIQNSGRLKFTSSYEYSGPYKAFATIPGKRYRIKFTLDRDNTPAVAFAARDDQWNNIKVDITYNSGTFELIFIATTYESRFHIEGTDYGVGGSKTFYLDNVVIEEVLEGYRYAFNTQEKDDEIAGQGNSYSAEFWQYDSRLGRRWNVDPKPDYSISPYAVFANNPIFLTDPNGDTTYVYNTKGQYAFTILDNMKSNEIVFLTDSRAKFLLTNKAYSVDEKARIARSPIYVYARFTENTAKKLRSHFNLSRDEAAGVLFINPKTKELDVWKCPDCKSDAAIGYANAKLGKMNLSDKNIKGEIFSIWHNHPLFGFGATQPSEYEQGNDFTAHSGLVARYGLTQFKSGGVGLINAPEHFTIFPLYNFDKGIYNSKSIFGLGQSSVLKPNFMKDYPMGEVKTETQYGTFNNKTLNYNNRWSK